MEILYSKTSLKYLSKLERQVRSNIVLSIENLPDRGDIRRMKGRSLQKIFRLRVGKFRVLFVKEEEHIKVVDIDTRGDIYK